MGVGSVAWGKAQEPKYWPSDERLHMKNTSTIITAETDSFIY